MLVESRPCPPLSIHRLANPPAEGSVVDREEFAGVSIARYADPRGVVERTWRILLPVAPIPCVVVRVRRIEGLISECSRDWIEFEPCEIFGTRIGAITRANQKFFSWGRTAPEKGYNKCDFEVEWADGSKYGGRFDLQRGGTDDGKNFRELLIHRLQFYAGMANPNHIDRRKYLRIIDMIGEVNVAMMRHVLTTCEL